MHKFNNLIYVIMSLNFQYRIANCTYFSDGNYISFDLCIRQKGVDRFYPCTFRFTSSNSLRSALSRQNFYVTIERHAHFVNSQALRNLELNSDLTFEFEDGYTGPQIHVYDWCKAMSEFAKKTGVYYRIAH